VILGLLAATLIPAPGCGGPGASPEPARLRVAAASDLQSALPILASAFRARGGSEVDASFGASGQLAVQIRQGAPFDVFLSADRRFVERLAGEGVVRADSVRPYAVGSLVIALGSHVGPKVRGLADLADPGFKFIAIANPETAPYGMAARQALERAGLHEALKPKLVIAGTVRQALQMVQSGNADAGLVGRSIAEAPGIRVVPLPPGASDPIVQCLGVVTRSTHPDEAAAFVAFLTSEDGQGILADLGFAKVPQGP